MFGIYRTLLAMAVAAAHLGGLQTGAHYAVFGFYTLSGYLMTLILHQTYGYSKSGFLKFILNRALRIFPPYWAAIALSALLAQYLGRAAVTSYHAAIFLPDSWKSLLQNLFLVFSYLSTPRLVPPAWSITVELFFYLCIGLGLSRTKHLTIAWLVISAVYTISINCVRTSFDLKYFLVSSASLPFATGAAIFHFRAEILRRLPALASERAPLVLLGLLVLDVVLAPRLHVYFSWGFYLSFALNALLIASLGHRKSILGFSKRVDAWLGDFSYPIYLVHLQAGLILLAAGFSAAKREQPLFFLVAMPILLVLAWALTRLVERPVELLRKRVKTSHSLKDQTPVSAEPANSAKS